MFSKEDFADYMKSLMPDEREMRIITIKQHSEAKKNKTCISYWYPKIKESNINIRMPKTIFVYIGTA